MKKYQKPQILFENFQLLESIAAGCEWIQQNAAEKVCAVLVKDWGETYFANLEICDMTPPGGNDSVCYHVPTADNNVFNS